MGFGDTAADGVVAADTRCALLKHRMFSLLRSRMTEFRMTG